MNTTNTGPDLNSPLHPGNIQTLVYQVRSVIKLLTTHQDLTDTLIDETNTDTTLVFTRMLLCDTLNDSTTS